MLERRLTILQAPAGFGKTTVLAGALEHHAAPCLLVLDDADRLPRIASTWSSGW